MRRSPEVIDSLVTPPLVFKFNDFLFRLLNYYIIMHFLNEVELQTKKEMWQISLIIDDENKIQLIN